MLGLLFSGWSIFFGRMYHAIIRGLHHVTIYEQQPLLTPRTLCSRSHSLMIPEAQPTPASTDMALPGQFLAQAPHSMQASASMSEAFLALTANT
jgi:hypothetical protein